MPTTTKTPEKLTPLQRELSRYMVWDPSTNTEDNPPVVTVEPKKVAAVVAKYLAKYGAPKLTAKQMKDVEDTTMPVFCSALLVYGYVTPKEYVKLLDGERLPHGKCDFPMDKGEKFVAAITDVFQRNWDQRSSAEIKVKPIPVGAAKAVDPILESHGVSPFNDIAEAYNDITGGISTADLEELKARVEELALHERDAMNKLEGAEKDNADLRSALSAANAKASMVVQEVVVEGDGTIPDGKMTTRNASDLFPIKLDQDFEVPFWEWDGPHPDVPAKDPNYIFRPKELARVLYAIVTNQRAYLQGHTGSGKTTLIEQVAAHLNWPFIRVNFDSEITRMDLIGRDTLTDNGDGGTISKFIDGILPRAMSSAYICCFDELDFVRPDVAYVMQAALEGNGLRITEDGDRLVQPDPMFRMFGTGNTVGQGDEHGMYQGARPQSMAFLDRFTIWMEIKYLSQKEREDLVKKHYPTLAPKQLKQLGKYTTEHLNAFMNGEVIKPISPRGMLAVARAATIMGDLKEALQMSIIDGASGEDKTTLKGIVDRAVS